MSNRTKDRDISITEFLNKLQEEWFISDFRRKIYASPADKRYYRKVMDYKKQKIEDISLRTKLSTIFNSDETKKDAYSKLFNDLNQPVFDLNEKDAQFYYDKDSEFIIHPFKQIGKIKSVDLVKNTADLILDEEVCSAKLADISRIL